MTAPNRRRRQLPIVAILLSWASVGAVAYGYWPAEPATCVIDHDDLLREIARLPKVTRFPPVPPYGGDGHYRLHECILHVTIAYEEAEAVAPLIWGQAFWLWGHEVGAHGLPVIALEQHGAEAFVVLGDRCERRAVIAEQLDEVWSRAGPQYPSLTFGPVDDDFDPAVLNLDASYAPLWSDGAVATR